MKTLTLASIYEIQGHRHEAAEFTKLFCKKTLKISKQRLP